ncbi:MAG TPA: efflux RND transporter permease subunit [Nevskiales bacterium]|nr:efflux RND transporter permease subunit [Nevskiales bacterium]
MNEPNKASQGGQPGGLQALVDRWSHGLIRQRRKFALLFALITVLMAASASQVRLDPGFLKLIPTTHPYMQTMIEYMDEFSGANTILVNLRWKGKGDIYNEEFMLALQNATDDVFFIPGINRTRVNSLFTPNTYYIEITEDGFDGKPVVPAEFSRTPEQLAQVRSNVENSGQIGLLVANDLKGSLIRADLLEYDRSKPRGEQKVDYWEVQKKLEEIRAKYENENIEVHIIGFAKLLGDVINGLLGVFAFFALAFLVTVALLYWYTRSWRITGTALVVAMLPVLWLIGCLPLIGYGIDPMSILVPFLIFAIGVSHAVQMTSVWRTEVMSGLESGEAASRAFSSLFIPGTTALLTDGLGFAVIMLIDIPIVHELGITASLGILLMIITNKMILPIILSYLTLEESSKRHSENALFDEGSPLLRIVSACAEKRVSWLVFAGTLVLLGFATWQSRLLVVGDSGTGVPELHEDSRYNMDSRAIASSYNIGVDLLTVIVEAKDFPTDSCLQYPVINLIDRFELYMRGVEGVQSVTSVAGIGKLVIAAFNEGNPRWRALPRTEVGLSTGSKAFDPNLGFNTEGCRAIQVMIFTKDHEGATIAHIVKEIKKFIAENQVEGVTMRLASGNVGVMAATNEAVGAAELKMLLSLFAALVVFCLLSFRSWIATLCVLVPLTLVTVMCNGLMAFLDIGLKTATLPVIALGVGVGVDYGLYLFERVQHYMADPKVQFKEAFVNSMRERGAAAVFTAFTMSIGVMTWTMSALKFQADMGLLLAFMFLVNVFGAICLLPALACWIYRQKGRVATDIS